MADDQPGDLIDRHALHLHTNRSVRVLHARSRMGCNDVSAGLQRTFQANICGPARHPRRGGCRRARCRRTRTRPSLRQGPSRRTAPCDHALHTSAADPQRRRPSAQPHPRRPWRAPDSEENDAHAHEHGPSGASSTRPTPARSSSMAARAPSCRAASMPFFFFAAPNFPGGALPPNLTTTEVP